MYSLLLLTLFTEPFYNTAMDLTHYEKIAHTQDACEAKGAFLTGQQINVTIDPDGRNEQTHRGYLCVKHGTSKNLVGEIIVTYDSRGKNERTTQSVILPRFENTAQCEEVNDDLHMLEVEPNITYRNRVIAQINCEDDNL